MDISPIFLYLWLPQLSPIIPIIYGAARFQRLDARPKLFLIYLIITFELAIGVIATALSRVNGWWVINLSTPLASGLLLWVLSDWLTFRIKLLLRLLVGLIVFIWLVEVTFLGRLYTPETVSGSLGDALLVLVAFYTIFKINREALAPILELPQFWVSAGTLIYYGGTIFVTILSSSAILDKYSSAFKSALLIQPTLLFVANILFIGVFRCQKEMSSGSSSLAPVSS